MIRSEAYLPSQNTTRLLPAYAATLLAADEIVCYRTRPRAMRLDMLLVLGAIVAALAIFSAAVEPGFIRLAILPALPLAGAHCGYLLHSPVIFVTDRRVVSAGRFLQPLSIDLARLKAARVQQSGFERRLGYGSLFLLVQPLQDLGEGVFVRYALPRLPDASALGSAIVTAAAERGIEIIVEDPRRGMAARALG